MNEKTKRDFVTQIITLCEEESSTMVEKGFDPAVKITGLREKKISADNAEIAQQKAAAAAMQATKVSNQMLDEAYKEASNTADLISGLYGKDSEIVKKIRKFRK